MLTKTRLRIDIKIIQKSGVVYKTTLRKRSSAWAFVEAKFLPESKGRCRVWYNKELDYWNEFEFTSISEFKEILAVDLEKDLVETFK